MSGTRHFREKRSMHETNSVLLSLVKRWKKSVDPKQVLQVYCSSSPTPTTLGLFLSDEEGIISYSVDPLAYLDKVGEQILQVGRGPNRFRSDYQAARMLTRYPFEGIRDTREAAIRSWTEAEEKCRLMNQKLKRSGFKTSVEGVNEIFHLARLLILDCLSEFCPSEWFNECQFGPGVTADAKDRLVIDKLLGPFGVTERAKPLADELILSSPVWLRARGGKLSTIHASGSQAFVPKNAKTDRSIETQPNGNVFLQAGIGRMIRKRLKRVGVNLSDQGRNQCLAREGSVDGSLATLDLSAASDSISYRLVEELIPSDWFFALNVVRVPLLELPDGTIHQLEKFSSMGNGYTFELESLIFWALTTATVRYRSQKTHLTVSIYGDDIICPTAYAHDVVVTLRECGFAVNQAKSFITGGFRESCGKDYFFGVEVSAFYIREPLSSVPSLIRVCNRVWRHANSRLGNNYLCDSFVSTWRFLVKLLPPLVRRSLIGPPDESDRWLIDTSDRLLSSPSVKIGVDRKAGVRSMWVNAILEKPYGRREDVSFDAVTASLLYFLEKRSIVEGLRLEPTKFNRLPFDIRSGTFELIDRKVRTKWCLKRTLLCGRSPETFIWT